MSKRNQYDEKRGVARIRWKEGAPPSGERGPFLVETWRPTLNAAPWNPTAQVNVLAKVEIRVRLDDGWKELRWNGLFPVEDGGKEFRRYAELPARWWHGNVTIDRWQPEAS